MATELKREVLERAVIRAMDEAANRPMRWGIDDCSLWCAGVLQEALGYDAGARFRGRYKTRLGAYRALGHGGLMGAFEDLAEKHAWCVIVCGEECVGDVGILRAGKASTAVICRAPGWFVARGLFGFAAVPAENVDKIWAVI